MYEEDHYVLYTLLQIFNVTDISVSKGPNDIPLVLLPEPIVMDTLYLEVVDYNSTDFYDRACWALALLGCLLSEGYLNCQPWILC